MKKKILIFSTAYLPLIGGAEIAVKEITDRFGDNFIFSAEGGPASSWEFDLICARIKKELPAQEKIGNVNVYRMGWGCALDKYYLALCGHYFAAKMHKKNHYNAIWAIMASFGGFAAMFFKKKNPTVPFLLTLQEGDPPEYIKKRVEIFGSWFSQIFTRADHIQAISNFLAGWAKDMGAKCSIEVVPNGVDVKKMSVSNFSPYGRSPEGRQFSKKDFKKKLGIIENDKVIITASRLVEKNGIADLIKAMSSLPTDVKLLILGSGPLENNLKLLALRSLGEGGDDKILFLGNVLNNDVPRYLAISDVFVRPSLSEGLGISFLEAMAAGVPIIGTKVGGIPDFLKDGETGLFCEVSSPKSIAEKINLLLSGEALRRKIIINAGQLVEEKYNWDKIADQIKAIIDRLTI